jgi:hypothetical protein
MRKSKTTKYGMKIKFDKSIGINVRTYIADVIRRINMDHHPRGFAGNAGWSDNLLTNSFGFSWYFKTEESRDIAHDDITQIFSGRILRNMNVSLLNNVEGRKKTFYKIVKKL